MIRKALARQYDVAWTAPDIQVVDVNLAGDRKLILHHSALNRILLDEKDARMVLQHLADLWGYDVLMKEVDPSTDAVLKEHAAGLSASEVCRKYGISDATFYKWRSRYGGMEVSDARRLKSLEDENRRLKKLLAESMLDASTLKEMLGKNF